MWICLKAEKPEAEICSGPGESDSGGLWSRDKATQRGRQEPKEESDWRPLMQATLVPPARRVRVNTLHRAMSPWLALVGSRYFIL